MGGLEATLILSARKTARMIKYAVTRPFQRMTDIEAGIKKLDWAGDKMLKTYGLTIDPNMIEVSFPSGR